MIQALLLVASVLGASVYYWQHNRELSYIQTLDSVNPHDVMIPKWQPHFITNNVCKWPILEPNEPDIQPYLRKRRRRQLSTGCRRQADIHIDAENGSIQFSSNDNSTRCVALDLNGRSPPILLEQFSRFEIPYASFVVECEQNGRVSYRKSFYNHRNENLEFQAMESTPMSPSIAVLYLKSVSHAQLQREFPKTVKSSKRFGFYSFSMLNKMSDNITEVLNGTFYHDDVPLTVGQYMKKERFCKVFTNSKQTGIESDYDLSTFSKSLELDSCQDKTTRLIEEWTKFSLDNTQDCYLSHIFVDNSETSSRELDESLSYAIEQFQLNDIYKKTMVVVVSAEGIPIGQFGNSYTGKVEERNPILMAHVPDKLKKIYPDHIFHLEQNQNRFLTHPDVFDLINSFARLSRDQMIVPTNEEFMEWRREHKRGISPWQSLIPANRTCYEAAIPDEFCLCMERQTEVEKAYNRTNEMAERVYEIMETDIQKTSDCIQEIAWIEERNYTTVFNLNEKVLEGVDDYIEYFYFALRVFSRNTSYRKNYFVNVHGQFKHSLIDEYSIQKSSPYVVDGFGSGCMAGYLEKFCEMCFAPKFLMTY